jgi:hypothetical protein
MMQIVGQKFAGGEKQFSEVVLGEAEGRYAVYLAYCANRCLTDESEFAAFYVREKV